MVWLRSSLKLVTWHGRGWPGPYPRMAWWCDGMWNGEHIMAFVKSLLLFHMVSYCFIVSCVFQKTHVLSQRGAQQSVHFETVFLHFSCNAFFFRHCLTNPCEHYPAGSGQALQKTGRLRSSTRLGNAAFNLLQTTQRSTQVTLQATSECMTPSRRCIWMYLIHLN